MEGWGWGPREPGEGAGCRMTGECTEEPDDKARSSEGQPESLQGSPSSPPPVSSPALPPRGPHHPLYPG